MLSSIAHLWRLKTYGPDEAVFFTISSSNNSEYNPEMDRCLFVFESVQFPLWKCNVLISIMMFQVYYFSQEGWSQRGST